MKDEDAERIDQLIKSGDNIGAFCELVRQAGGRMTMFGEPVAGPEQLRESVTNLAAFRTIAAIDKMPPPTAELVDADTKGKSMRALSLSQPWCWAILHGGKRVENRKWKPRPEMIGQRIALHAAKSWDATAPRFLELELGLAPPVRVKLLTSCIVGIATIDRVVTDPLELPEDQRPWFFGPYGWVLRDVVPLRLPVEIGGSLGLWPLPELVDAAVRGVLGETA